MPHQCLKCNTIYDNTSNSIITGCTKCGSKLFLYIRKIPQQKEEIEISKETKEQIIKEIQKYPEIQESDSPVILKLENIRIKGPGKYEIDINQLMKKEKPPIYRIQEGTYIIDLDYLTNKENEN